MVRIVLNLSPTLRRPNEARRQFVKEKATGTLSLPPKREGLFSGSETKYKPGEEYKRGIVRGR